MARVASCSCGQLTVACDGEPVRRSICHCLNCQRRTGSVFAVQVRFARADVRVHGEARAYVSTSDEGNRTIRRFCPHCGSTVYWEPDSAPDIVYVAVGAFADPAFPPPTVSVYEERKHGWVMLPEDMEHVF